MDNKIFRKVSVERLSSPENLDQVLRVVPTKNGMALVCLLVLVAVIVAWACLGENARQVQGSGILLPVCSGAPREAVAVFSAADGGAIRVGMDAFADFPSGSNAAMAGQVAAVLPEDGVSGEGMGALPPGAIKALAMKPGDVVVLVRLGAGEPAGARPTPAEGEPCRVDVTVERFRPARLLAPD